PHVGQMRHRRVFEEDIAESTVGRKVERRIETCVFAVASDATSECGGDGRIAIENFTDGGQVWKSRMQLDVKAVPERSADIGERVDAQAVGTGLLDPPHRVLDEVLRGRKILLIQIGKDISEPAFENVPLISVGRVGSDEQGEFAERLMMVG